MSEVSASVADPRAITRDIFSATIGSIACCYTGQPLDTIKVRMQTNPGQFTSVVSSTMSIFKNEVSCSYHAFLLQQYFSTNQTTHTQTQHTTYFDLTGNLRLLEGSCTNSVGNGCRKRHGLWS